MTTDWLHPDAVFHEGTLSRETVVRLRNGRVTDLSSAAQHPGAKRISGILSPGYLDLQVNGGGGVLLNRQPDVAAMETIAAAHRRFGTVGLMPTVITDAPEVLEQAALAAIEARGRAGILGLHIEGPHIAPARKGTHDTRFIRPIDAGTFAVVERLREAGVTVMITLAPEEAPEGAIRRLAETGAIVSLGHTDATAAQMKRGFAEGARAVTHLFNAMSPMQNREPGATGAAIGSEAYCGFICDGHHVSDDMLALAIRARPVPGRMFLVSDAMPTVGGKASFDLYGSEIALKDGRLINAQGSLAGAHVTMAESAARLVSELGLSPEAALSMAVTVPADLIDRPDLGRITDRATADLILLAEDFEVIGTLEDQLRTVDA